MDWSTHSKRRSRCDTGPTAANRLPLPVSAHSALGLALSADILALKLVMVARKHSNCGLPRGYQELGCGGSPSLDMISVVNGMSNIYRGRAL